MSRLEPGQELELAIEKPAAGGRMIARHEGQVLLVLGAIPGERVRARVARTERQLAFADLVEVIEPSAARRDPHGDPLCGGCLYAHVAYDEQLRLKAQVIDDAFRRIGRIPLPEPAGVKASPDRAYRMRARLHVRGRRVGFYREGTHELCDARATAQLTDAALDAAEHAAATLADGGHAVASVELAENIGADARAAHVTLHSEPLPEPALLDIILAGGLTGLTIVTARGAGRTSGTPVVSDPLPTLTRGRARSGALGRRAESFFQANRFLIPDLVAAVLERVLPDGDVLDLYAGVGLFAVSLAATGRRGVTAVEGDRSGGRDLRRNAAPFRALLRVVHGSVEHFLRGPGSRRAKTLILDPPRTGISRAAVNAVAAYGASRIVYVSCDPATMARDARRLVDAGYTIRSLEAFDLFPNTPHVETVACLDRP